MTKSILGNRFTVAGTAILLCLVAATGSLLFWAMAQGDTPTAEWPALTMSYETTRTYSGETEPSTLKRQLEYSGLNNWKTTVIEAPTIDRASGSFTQLGSYVEVRNGQITTYDSVTGELETEPLEEGDYYLPVSRMVPIDFSKIQEAHAAPPIERTTDTKVCFDEECDDNATGWVFVQEDGSEFVYADDARGIPLALPGVTITEVLVTGGKESIQRD